jgi:hypothetical protein
MPQRRFAAAELWIRQILLPGRRRKSSSDICFLSLFRPELFVVTGSPLETEIEAGAIKKVVLITVTIEISEALNEYRLEARHVVIQFDWPKCQMAIDVQIEPSADLHGKCGRGIHEALR